MGSLLGKHTLHARVNLVLGAADHFLTSSAEIIHVPGSAFQGFAAGTTHSISDKLSGSPFTDLSTCSGASRDQAFTSTSNRFAGNATNTGQEAQTSHA
jgi:hypothetical protein